jgi:hypothetical protein
MRCSLVFHFALQSQVVTICITRFKKKKYILYHRVCLYFAWLLQEVPGAVWGMSWMLSKIRFWTLFFKGQVMILAFSPRPITDESWVQYLAIPYAMCAAQTENAKYISPFTYILTCQCPSPMVCSHLHFMLLFSDVQPSRSREPSNKSMIFWGKIYI